MAFENLFIRTRRSIAGIALDGVINEGHSNRVEKTEYFAENGVPISDHAVVLPKEINIQAVVTNTPLGATAFGEIIDPVTDFFGSATETNITRTQAAYRDLVDFMSRREVIDVQTKLALYTNMLITSIDTNIDAFTSEAPMLFIQCQEMVLTETEVVQLDPRQLEQGSVRTQGSSPNRRGRQEGQEPTENTNRSVLKAVSDWIGFDL